VLSGGFVRSPIISDLGFRPDYLTDVGNIGTIFTYMFVHASFVHIIGNMLFLFLIGVQLEYRVGKMHTFIFYFVAGLGAAITQALMVGLDSRILMVGASGAVAGLVGAMLMLYPREKIPMLIGPIFLPNVPVIWAAGVFLATQLFLDIFYGTGSGGGVAYAAHLGGFVIGMALAAALPKAQTRGTSTVKPDALASLATTQLLKDDLIRIREESEPAVQHVWIEHFVKHATCPKCGGKLELKGNKVKSTCGYELKLE
jgi:membrane associated rhomboid family serine protease